MSGRIRSVKPEWMEDSKIGCASDEARLLSIGLMLVADDYGRGRADPRYLAGQMWWGDLSGGFAKSSRGLRELERIGFVHLYEVAGDSYFEIRHWAKHQKVDHPGKPRVPEPLEEPRESSREPRENLANPPENLAPDLRSPISDQGGGSSGARAHDPGTPDSELRNAQPAGEAGTEQVATQGTPVPAPGPAAVARSTGAGEPDAPAPQTDRPTPKKPPVEKRLQVVLEPSPSDPPARQFFHLGAITSTFQALYDRYPRKERKAEAAAEFQRWASVNGGEEAFAKKLHEVWEWQLKTRRFTEDRAYVKELVNYLEARMWLDEKPAAEQPKRKLRESPVPHVSQVKAGKDWDYSKSFVHAQAGDKR